MARVWTTKDMKIRASKFDGLASEVTLACQVSSDDSNGNTRSRSGNFHLHVRRVLVTCRVTKLRFADENSEIDIGLESSSSVHVWGVPFFKV